MARSVRTIETKIPRTLANQADKRARTIFEQECRYGRSFVEAIGAVYMIGIQAGIEAALGREPYNETEAPLNGGDDDARVVRDDHQAGLF